MSATSRTVNGVAIEDILQPLEIRPDLVQRISTRKVKAPELAIVPPDPQWPVHFQSLKVRIETALQNSKTTVLAINHVGSTSVPDLPAKAVIDIDLVLSDNSLSAEPQYVPQLEAAGFQFLLREPAWHEHRFFAGHEPISCNLHVFGPGSPEVERHKIFRDWLKKHEDDRKLYAQTKVECAAASSAKKEIMDQYNERKQEVLREILNRAFRDLGYLDGE